MNTERPFTCWHRHMEGPALALVVYDPAGGNPLEWRTLDVRDLPHRPDLLARLGAVAQVRLIADAARAERDYSGVPRIAEELDGPAGEYACIRVVDDLGPQFWIEIQREVDAVLAQRAV